MWRPGIRTGVKRGSTVHLVEFFGPVLGVMTAATLAEAIGIQNEVDYGLTAGLHSLDPAEIATWLDQVQAGNLYVNRGTTGAVVRRQPFGGWKKSVVGAGFKAGGPNYLLGLGDWAPAQHSDTAGPIDSRLQRALDAAGEIIEAADLASLRRAFASDTQAWSTQIGVAKDVSELTAERNLLRYHPLPVHVRLAENGSPTALVRVLGAALLTGAPVDVSVPPELPDWTKQLSDKLGFVVTAQSDARWQDSMATRAPARIRLIGGDARALAIRTGGRPDVAVYAHAVTESGRLELLPFVREQAISITAHRFGTPNHLTDTII